MGTGGQALWPPRPGLRACPRPGEAGWGWRSPPGGLADTAAAGRALLSCTKLLFSEAPSSPGLEPVGGRGTAGMCRVRRGPWEGISARCQILTALTADPVAASSRKPASIPGGLCLSLPSIVALVALARLPPQDFHPI